MPIDATIPLGVKPVQAPDPVESYGKLLALRHALTQQQQQATMFPLQQQEAQARLTASQQENQQRATAIQVQQRQQAQAQLVREAQVATSGDLDKTLDLVRGKVDPDLFNTMQKHAIETKKGLGELQEQQRKQVEFSVQQIGASAQNVLNAPPEQKQAAWQAEVQRLQQNGVDVSKFPPQYPGDEAMQSERLHGMGLEKYLAESRAQKKADAEMPGVIAESDSKVQKALGQEKTQPAEQQRLDETALQNQAVRENMQAMREQGAGRLAVEQGNLALAKKKNEMEYGAGTTEFWVHQLQDNPDSIKELPPAMRSVVGKGFTAATGLPLPTALSGQTQQSETAARNALDGISFIRKALQNPEIQKQIGPIMGRLGNAEQRIGTAAGLSPEAEQLAQELRTRMRYFVFQEGKAVLGGRLPAQLMQSLEQSSPNVKMDANMMLGAVKGAEDNAQSVMDNADKQRFGGKMRTREARGVGASPAAGGAKAPAVGTIDDGHRFKGGDPSKPENWEKQ